MVCSAERFGQEALCCGRVLLGRKEKVEGRAAGVHRPIQVAPLAFDLYLGFVDAPTINREQDYLRLKLAKSKTARQIIGDCTGQLRTATCRASKKPAKQPTVIRV
jgi:hypothetical protein